MFFYIIYSSLNNKRDLSLRAKYKEPKFSPSNLSTNSDAKDPNTQFPNSESKILHTTTLESPEVEF